MNIIDANIDDIKIQYWQTKTKIGNTLSDHESKTRDQIHT